MVNYPGRIPNNPVFLNRRGGDRFFFPFLTGALVGGAAVGLTRPRPIYNVAPQPPMYPYPPGPMYPPYYPRPYSNVSYNYSSYQ